jgi:hypothetical protein
MDYTYTMFDVNMVPIEATMDLAIMRMYLPTSSSADIVNPLVTQFGQTGNVTFPYAPGATFNSQKGVVQTKGTIGGVSPAGVWL